MQLQLLVFTYFASLAVARPQSTSGTCDVEPLQCCNTLISADSSEAQSAATALGISLIPGTNVGLSCK